MKKKKHLDIREMELVFQIPESGIDAIVNGWNMSFAPGRYVCTDAEKARFLYRYPGVELISARPLPPPGPITADDPRVFDQCPEPTRVFNGGFSGGGVAEAKTKDNLKQR